MIFVAVFREVLSLSLMGSIIAALIIVVKAIFRQKFRAKWHYLIWFILIIRLMVPYFPESNFSIYNLLKPASYDVGTYINRDSNPENIDAVPDNIRSSYNMSSHDDGIENKSAENLYIYDILSIVWIIGVLIFLIWTISVYMRFTKSAKANIMLEDQQNNEILNDCKKYMGIDANIPVIFSDNVMTPSITGIFKPRILIPYGLLDKLSANDIKYVFIHELSHYRRMDILINWLILVLQAINWFNPVIWYAFHKMRQDLEIACDEYVLDHIRGNEWKKYGETIIKLAQMAGNRGLIPGTAGIASKSEIKRRIIMISMFKNKSVLWSILAIILALVIGYVGLTNAKKVIDSKKNEQQIENQNQYDNSTDKNGENQSEIDISSGTSQNDENTANNKDADNNQQISNDSKKTVVDTQKQLIDTIVKLAKDGKIINSDAIAGKTVIEDMMKKLGKPDSQDYVGSAKGTYVTYEKKGVVFGFNKGSQIFESRSYDSRLKTLTLKKVEGVLGKPAYDQIYNKEHIIGYVMNSKYKLKFIFPQETKNNPDPRVDHVNVFYPQGTVNNMSEDPGRKW